MKDDIKIKLLNDQNDTHSPVGKYKFTAPIAGYYNMQAEIIEYIHTGKFEDIKNPSRKWYQFWKPRIIKQEILKSRKIKGGQQVKYLKASESVDSEWVHRV